MLKRSRRCNNLLFLSGVGPAPHRNSANFAEQCADVFEQVATELTNNDSSWEDLIDVTVFLTDINADLATFQELWAAAFPAPAPMPATTIVQASALAEAGAICLKCMGEIKK